jgi:RNA polymerase sigma factor (TIGR02999 family)
MSVTTPFKQTIQRELTWLYPWLLQFSRRLLGNERPGHTLQPTALAHEVLGKLLVWEGEVGDSSQRDLQQLAASVARKTLIDSGRRFAARQKAIAHITAKAREHREISPHSFDELLAALEQLQKIDSQISRLAELRFFEGYSEEDAAEILGISSRTASRKWKFAKAYLAKHLAKD